MNAKPHVVVLGGGFGGLESLFYLRHKLGDRARLTLVSENDYFVFKPNTIYIPFGESPDKYRVDLVRPTTKQNIEFHKATVRAVDPGTRTVETTAGSLRFDHLVIATGAAMRGDEVPGLAEHAVTVWTVEEMLRLRNRIEWAMERASSGERTRFLFLVPPNNKCAGPLYELVLMLDTHLERARLRDKIDIVFATKEEAFIEAFGPRLNTVVTGEFEERGIEGHVGFVVTGVEPGLVHFQNREKLPYDVLVSFPPYIAGKVYPGLPADDRGFLRVESNSRRVYGHERLFAAGDAANFPVKQAFLALLQGDAVGDHLAAEILGTKPEVQFEPMSMCVMEELNKATFAQVPLVYSDDSRDVVKVDVEDEGHYKVGVSPMWRMGKRVLGLYLPWRFGSGKPFHAGFAWEAMDLGLKVMAKLLAK
jgi:sulfide:quinone oxidoreductase